MNDNPYVAGDPVGGTSQFIGRQDILDEVFTILPKPRDNVILLYGRRRIGKTSILKQLTQLLPKQKEREYIPVYFDLQDKSNLTLENLLRDLARAIVKAVNLDQSIQNQLTSLASTEQTFYDQFLPKVLEELPSNSSLVLLLDEFDELDIEQKKQQREHVVTIILPYLRRLTTLNQQQLKFVFVVGREVSDLSPKALSLFKGAATKRVSLLDRKETERLVNLSANSLKWEDAAVTSVWELTHGHPYLTQRLCKTIWDQADSQNEQSNTPRHLPIIKPKMVHNAVSATLKDSEAALQWIWRGLSPDERVVASAIAELTEAGSDVISPKQLETILSNRHAGQITRHSRGTADNLIEWDLLEKAPGGYRFTIELIRKWLIERKPLALVIKQVNPLATDLYRIEPTHPQAQKIKNNLEIGFPPPQKKEQLDGKQNKLNLLKKSNIFFFIVLFVLLVMMVFWFWQITNSSPPAEASAATKTAILPSATPSVTMSATIGVIGESTPTPSASPNESTVTATPTVTVEVTPTMPPAPIPTFDVEKISNEPIHSDHVDSVAFSPDGKWLASGGADGKIVLLNLENNTREIVGAYENVKILSVAFKPDGTALAYGSSDQIVRLWDVNNKQIVQNFTGLTGKVQSVLFSPDGKRLAAGMSDGSIRIWNLENNSSPNELQDPGAVQSLSFSPDGTLLASGGPKGIIRLWHVESGELSPLKEAEPSGSIVFTVAFSPNGKLIASGSEDGAVRLWNMESRQVVFRFSDHERFVKSVAFSPDGEVLASGSQDKTIRLWNVQNGTLLVDPRKDEDDVLSVTFDPTGTRLASGLADGSISLWSLSESR